MGDGLAAERPLDARPKLVHRQRGRVDDQIGRGADGGEHRAFCGNSFGQRLIALQRVAATVLLVSADQDVVGGL